MKYVSLDLETTCIYDKSPKNILMVSMVVEDTTPPMKALDELPHFTCFVNYETISGEPFALAMNSWILNYISGRNKNPPPYPVYNGGTWIDPANQFLNAHFTKEFGKIPVAGKNVASFDLQFLPEVLQKRFMHRTIDPTSVFIDFNQQRPPSLEDVKKSLGLDAEVSHDAREDALDVIKVLRRAYGDKR
jgi:hypothetical protein